MSSITFLPIQLTYGMHIAEGFLPQLWSLFWFVVFLPCLMISIRYMTKQFKINPKIKMLYVLMAAFAFTLSSLKIPSLAGSCSHPTGMGLGAIIVGPLPMMAIGTVVLLLQALLIAHGGLTTLGANAFSMAIVGPLVSFGLYKGLEKLGVSQKIRVFIAAFIGSLSTYLVTSIQLGIAFSNGNILETVVKFIGVFMVTQVPISLAEGLLTVVVFNLLSDAQLTDPIVNESL